MSLTTVDSPLNQLCADHPEKTDSFNSVALDFVAQSVDRMLCSGVNISPVPEVINRIRRVTKTAGGSNPKSADHFGGRRQLANKPDPMRP